MGAALSGALLNKIMASAAGVVAIACSLSMAHADDHNFSTPKNIIMVVGDGMGPAYTTAYRYYNDTDHSDGISRTIFDELLVGSASTYPAVESGIVTDSAAAATALSAGIKTYNGAIAVDANRQPLNTVLREAKRLGMRTGLAVTSQIVHATPAAYTTHNEYRRNYNQIADQFFDDRIDGKFVVDVMLGGGTRYFEREDRDLIAQFIDAGYQYTDSYNKLATYAPGQNMLGLFAPVGLPWALDDRRKHRLSYLTSHAIKHLENDNGFFLLVEASQVDWAGHGNDIASAMAEMDDLAKTMIFLKDYVIAHPDTLVILTADHSTGGMTMGANGDYRWEPQWLKSMQSSVSTIANKVVEQAEPASYVAAQLGFTLTDEESNAVKSLAQEGDKMLREQALKRLIDQRTNTGWTTGGHTAVDVPVFAMGEGAYLLTGSIDNTDIAKTLFALLDGRPPARLITPAIQAGGKGPNALKQQSADKLKKQKQELCNFKEDWHCN